MEADQGAVDMEEIITINDEMHLNNAVSVTVNPCPKINNKTEKIIRKIPDTRHAIRSRSSKGVQPFPVF
jgi:hypothetical protein